MENVNNSAKKPESEYPQYFSTIYTESILPMIADIFAERYSGDLLLSIREVIRVGSKITMESYAVATA